MREISVGLDGLSKPLDRLVRRNLAPSALLVEQASPSTPLKGRRSVPNRIGGIRLPPKHCFSDSRARRSQPTPADDQPVDHKDHNCANDRYEETP